MSEDEAKKWVEAYLASEEGQGDSHSRPILLRFADWLEEQGAFQLGL